MKIDPQLSLFETNPLVLAAELAKPFESCRLSAYHDCVGFPTQGWGHLLSRVKGEDLSGYPDWTQVDADDMLERDMFVALRSVKRMLRVPATPNQIAALTDFAFNLGGGALQASTLLRCVNRGEFDRAADEFMRWNKAGGVVYRGLTKRRAAERALFLKDLV